MRIRIRDSLVLFEGTHSGTCIRRWRRAHCCRPPLRSFEFGASPRVIVRSAPAFADVATRTGALDRMLELPVFTSALRPEGLAHGGDLAQRAGDRSIPVFGMQVHGEMPARRFRALHVFPSCDLRVLPNRLLIKTINSFVAPLTASSSIRRAERRAEREGAWPPHPSRQSLWRR